VSRSVYQEEQKWRGSQWGPLPVAHGAHPAEPSTAADALQLTLRFSFQARLSASVGPLCLSDVECRMAEYKKNHSVPRFMLEYWVDPSTPHKGIHVYEIATRRTYVSTGQSKKPFSFAITTDLYIHTTNGSRAVGLERWFSGLESSLAVFVRQAHMRESISYTSVQECTKVLMAILGLECRSRYNIGLMQATLESDSILRF
jgi:hypothetical protein